VSTQKNPFSIVGVIVVSVGIVLSGIGGACLNDTFGGIDDCRVLGLILTLTGVPFIFIGLTMGTFAMIWTRKLDDAGRIEYGKWGTRCCRSCGCYGEENEDLAVMNTLMCFLFGSVGVSLMAVGIAGFIGTLAGSRTGHPSGYIDPANALILITFGGSLLGIAMIQWVVQCRVTGADQQDDKRRMKFFCTRL
jgi:hypothetical protein